MNENSFIQLGLKIIMWDKRDFCDLKTFGITMEGIHSQKCK